LNKIWPWRNPEVILNKDTDQLISENVIQILNQSSDVEYKILQEQNVWPADYLMGDSNVIMVIIMAVLGLLSVLVLSKFEK